MRLQKRSGACKQLPIKRNTQLACPKAWPIRREQGLGKIWVTQQHLAVFVDEQAAHKKGLRWAQISGLLQHGFKPRYKLPESSFNLVKFKGGVHHGLLRFG